ARRAGRLGQGGIIHFDISGKQVGKIVPTNVGVVGDAAYNLAQLLPQLEAKPRPEWHAQLNAWKQAHPFRYRNHTGPNRALKPQRVIEELYTQTKHRDDVIISTGVGQHQMWAAQFYRWRQPRSLVSSGGLGTMGFGLPAAIGAKVAKPNHLVVDIDGDASFSMTLMELATAAEFNVGVKVLLLNNNAQGMVKQWQDLFYDERYSSTIMKNPDFVKLAQAMNCQGLRCASQDDLADKMAEFLAADGPIVGEFIVDGDEHCYPMVGAANEMFLRDFDTNLTNFDAVVRIIYPVATSIVIADMAGEAAADLVADFHAAEWEDVTQVFHRATDAMTLGQLVHVPDFNYFESMSALELMDPKMDSGMLAPDEVILTVAERLEKGLVPLTFTSAADLLATLDRMEQCEAAWRNGQPMAQSLLTCLYFHPCVSSALVNAGPLDASSVSVSDTLGC
ncbi:hypothetical protein AaE_008150, partial [Aphanomyces astaci]